MNLQSRSPPFLARSRVEVRMYGPLIGAFLMPVKPIFVYMPFLGGLHNFIHNDRLGAHFVAFTYMNEWDTIYIYIYLFIDINLGCVFLTDSTMINHHHRTDHHLLGISFASLFPAVQSHFSRKSKCIKISKNLPWYIWYSSFMCA